MGNIWNHDFLEVYNVDTEKRTIIDRGSCRNVGSFFASYNINYTQFKSSWSNLAIIVLFCVENVNTHVRENSSQKMY